MGNIFTILDDIWDWICLNAEDIVLSIICIGSMIVIFGGMIYLLIWSATTSDGSNSGSNSSSISSSVSSSAVVSMESSNVASVENSSAVLNVVSDKLD